MEALRSIIKWISSDKSLAPATWGLVLVTFLLVVATAFLYFDGLRKSKQQERRWEAEDNRREEEVKPSAVVEIAVREDAPLDMCFACFNLGINTFFVDRMIVTTSDGTFVESDLSPMVLTPGSWIVIDFDPLKLLGMFGEPNRFKEASCVMHLKGAKGIVVTEPVWFYVGYGNQRADWTKGRLADRQEGAIVPQPKVLRIPRGVSAG